MPRDDSIELARDYLRRKLEESPRDGSHDWWHTLRVHALAKTLAEEEGIKGESLLAVELAAILHDVEDYKYAEGSIKSDLPTLESFLHDLALPSNIRELTSLIVRKVGFKEELHSPQRNVPIELAIVQDADRLDALGAIGIARCFMYAGYRGHVMYDPHIAPRVNGLKEKYGTEQQPALNHFHEKLLKLKDLMKTRAGKRMAAGRHRVLVDFLEQFEREWRAAD